jgi:hypothetical protein|tara:strand:+ start:404 stop:547 length:144 start_codon:yes stop_codon:yes gene_type:complete
MKDRDELISQLETIADQLGGTIKELITSNSSGRTSKKIVIEYDVKLQ